MTKAGLAIDAEIFKQTFTALITPFKSGKIDFKSLERLIHFQSKNGISGFVINGTTAESPTLSKEEVSQIFSLVKKTFPNFKLIVGTGSNSTQETVESSLFAENLGADACLVVVPYYNKPPQRGLIQHFRSIAEALKKTPILLYNVPGRTVTSLDLSTIKELSEVPGIIGIKEASGNIEFAKQIHGACGEGFALLSGDDGTYVEFLAEGRGQGVISVASHIIPQEFIEILYLCQNNKTQEAKQILVKYKNLIDLLFCEANPIPVKKALFLMGIIESAECRLPLVELSAEWTEKLSQEMKRVGLI